MTPSFALRTTSRYERLVRKLLKGHPELRDLQRRVREMLRSDPYR